MKTSVALVLGISLIISSVILSGGIKKLGESIERAAVSAPREHRLNVFGAASDGSVRIEQAK